MIPSHIYISKRNRLEKVLLDDILYLEANGSSTTIVVKDAKKGKTKFVLSDNLKNISAQIENPNFLRVSRKYVINRNKVEAIDGKRLVIEGILIRYSDSYKTIVATQFPVLKVKTRQKSFIPETLRIGLTSRNNAPTR